MTANEIVESIVAKLDASDTWGALMAVQALRSNPGGLDDAHKVQFADAMLRFEWGTTPARPPRKTSEPG